MSKLLSFVGLPLLLTGVLALLFFRVLFATGPLFIAIQIAAAGLMIWARLTFGIRSFHPGAAPTSGGLVTAGPYRFIRHPIYTAICLFCMAGVINHWSVAAGSCLAVVFAGALFRMTAEERLLLLEYPDYKSYIARTKRMIPFVY
jgi:protein-S-isoprenylcysteine O-methyltransferase Ste14